MKKQNEEEWIDFPCVFPLKVMGLNDGDYQDFVYQVCSKYVNGLDKSQLKTNLSRNKKYISVTVSFMAQNRQQLDNIYMEIHQDERSRMAL